ncbi:MAG: hypothetical protein ACE5FG_15420, partial [Myxococcota bacterium]
SPACASTDSHVGLLGASLKRAVGQELAGGDGGLGALGSGRGGGASAPVEGAEGKRAAEASLRSTRRMQKATTLPTQSQEAARRSAPESSRVGDGI